jgi:hypothetical protein
MKEKSLTSIDLVNAINKMIKKVQPTIIQKIIFHKDLNPVLEIDEMVFQTVIQIFLENASKLSPPQSTIKVGVITRGDSIDISVSGEGAVFTAEEKENVFKLSPPNSSDNVSERLTSEFSTINKYAESLGAWVFISDNFPKGNVFHLVFNLNVEKS